MIIPVPEWENEVAWPGGNLAQSVSERLGAEYDLACDRPSAQPTSTALAQCQARKEAMCSFFARELVSLALGKPIKTGCLFCLLCQLGPPGRFHGPLASALGKQPGRARTKSQAAPICN